MLFRSEQWLDPERLLEKAQREWDSYFEKEDAFELVKNKDHWKGRIDAIVPVEKQRAVADAIGFFAFGCATFHRVRGRRDVVRVTAPGYWAYEAGERR